MSIDREAITNGHGGQRATRVPERLEPLLTIHELALVLRLSEKTVRRLVAARRIPCIRLGRVLRFRSADLLRFVEARKE